MSLYSRREIKFLSVSFVKNQLERSLGVYFSQSVLLPHRNESLTYLRSVSLYACVFVIEISVSTFP